MVQVTVIGNDVGQSLKVLKKKMQREGIFREMKLRRCHEKNSEKKARRQALGFRRQGILLTQAFPAAVAHHLAEGDDAGAGQQHHGIQLNQVG